MRIYLGMNDERRLDYGICRFTNKDRTIVYAYIFVDGKLTTCTQGYEGFNNQYMSIV